MKVVKARRWMRLSLIYPCIVLLTSGIGLLLAPHVILNLFQSSRVYDPVILRFSGMFMCVLSVFVAGTVAYRVRTFYNWTLYLRFFMAICLLNFYQSSQNPLFLYVLGVLITGLILSFAGIAADRRAG